MLLNLLNTYSEPFGIITMYGCSGFYNKATRTALPWSTVAGTLVLATNRKYLQLSLEMKMLPQ